MKLLQLNLFKGYAIDTVINFIKERDFDVVHLQEVSGPLVSFNRVDCFKKIQEETKMRGDLAISWTHLGSRDTYFGNATFFKEEFVVSERREVILKPFCEVRYPNDPPVESHPRRALSLTLSRGGKKLSFVNTHQAWGPTPEDSPSKLEQAKILHDHVKNLDDPFILTGDFNMVPGTEVIRFMERLGRNLIVEKGITNTLDARAHRAKHLFPQGLACDFIFTHPSLCVKEFSLLDEYLLSDHFGLYLEIDS